MKLAILGSGTAIPHPHRGASGYACVARDGSALLVECGPGSTRRWPRHGLRFESVRAIAVTHYHVDHCGDLAAVMFARNVPEPPVTTPLLLVGPAGHARHVAALREIYGTAVEDPHGVIAVRELRDGGVATAGPFEIEGREVAHSPGALGLRVRADGRLLAFSGDSGPCDELVELCRGTDLALLECSYPAGRESRSHLNAATAAATAAAADVGRLVLTHFYSACDDVDIGAQVREAGYEGELQLARDGDEIEV